MLLSKYPLEKLSFKFHLRRPNSIHDTLFGQFKH